MNKVLLDNNVEMEDTPETEWLLMGVDVDARIIEIRSEVNETMASIITRGILKMQRISQEPIQIYLSSFGGDAYESLSIYDCIKASPCDVHIIATGKIMSAAFIVFLAGDQRIASDHTTFMMHSASYGAEGTVKNHEVQVTEGKRLNNKFLDIASTRTKRNRKWWYRKILSSDFYFDVVEAREIGVLTGAQPSTANKKVSKKLTKKVVKQKITRK